MNNAQRATKVEPTHRPGFQRWLTQYVDSLEEATGGVVVLRAKGHPEPVTVGECPAHGKLTTSLVPSAQAALKRDRPVVVAPAVRLVNADYNRVIAVPLRSGGRVFGAVALAVQAGDSQATKRLVEELERACAGLGGKLVRRKVGKRVNPLGQVLKQLSALLAPPTLAEGAMALVTELAAATGCERVLLGVLDPEMEVIAISNSAAFKAEQSLLQMAAAAMREAADQGARVNYPAFATDPARVILAHAELHARTGHALLTVPLVHAGRAVGALLVEFRAAELPAHEQIVLCEGVASAIGPLVSLRQTAERSLRVRAADSVREHWRQFARRDNPLPKLVLATVLGSLAAVSLVPVTYRIGASARLEGAVQRVIAAPFDGFLMRAHVRPGDAVRAGDLLAEMADHDLVLEQRKWESALTQQENALAAALARSDRAQFVISQGKADEARSQLALVRQQLARTRLAAPIDGVVIKGDLSQSLGAPVQRGDALMTVAPREQYRLIVDVDERDIASILRGQTGHLALTSLPLQTQALVVERVTPVSAVRDGRNIFEVEARLANQPLDLRPGLQGVAKIEAGQRSLAWIWSHRLVDWVRLSWWSW